MLIARHGIWISIKLKKKLQKTKIILAVHIYGLPTYMPKLIKIAKKYNLKVIEDASEVIGLKINNRMCGSFGDISTFSFIPTNILLLEKEEWYLQTIQI